MSTPASTCPLASAARLAVGESIDSFHRGRFHLIQPKARGHRAGIDAMLLASLVPDDATGALVDLGAGAGAAGLAVVARAPAVRATLVERAPEMVDFARRSLALPQNAVLRDRVAVVRFDVTERGAARRAAGLADDGFDHAIMNPPFNDPADRPAPDALKAEAHAMTQGLLAAWIRTAGALTRPGGQLSVITRPQSLAEIEQACAGRFGGLEVTPVHPRAGADAIRILVTGIRASRARLRLRFPLVLHGPTGHAFLPLADNLNNGRAFYPRQG